MKTPQLLPLPMARYGMNSYGEPLFRVVWSDSITDLFGVQKGEEIKFDEYPAYPEIHAWVLEKFQTSEEYAGSKMAYDAKEAAAAIKLGPYPERGKFVHCYTFPYEPTDSMISLVVRGIAASRNLTNVERKDSIMAPLLARRNRQHQRIDDIFHDAQDAFKGGAVGWDKPGIIHRKKNRKASDVQFKRSAEDIGLPMSDNAFFTGDEHGNKRSQPLAGA
jgi:hypothetical protein